MATFIFCLAATYATSAQQASANSPAVTGIVRTSEGTPIPGATVHLIANDTKKVWLSWTDESGKFEFPQVAAGQFNLEVSQLGFVQTSLVIQVPVFPSGPIPVVLRVATLTELSTTTRNSGSNREGRAGNRQGDPGAKSGNVSNTAGSWRGDGGGRGQLPAGAANALREGMGGGGFEQADLTGEGTNEQAPETGGSANEGSPAAVAFSANANSNATSDSFLMKGTVGQSLATNGAGGFGLGGLVPGTPGNGPSGQRGQGGPGGFDGRGAGGQLFGAEGGAGGGPGGPASGGRMFGGRGGRLGSQTVNRIRFSFYNRYDNSAFDARPYSITGNQIPKPSHYDERFGGNLGGPLKIPHIYNGSDKTYFFVNYQHEIQSSALDTYSTVPAPAERSGDFCGLGITLYNPFSNFTGPRTPLGNGCQVPTINSAAAGLLAYYPEPNLPGTVQNYLLQTTVPINNDIVNLHVLHTINSKFSLNAGYNLNSQRQNTFGNFLNTAGTRSTLSQAVTLGLSHNWTPHLVENTQLNWSRSRVQILSDNSFKNNIGGDLGITGISADPLTYGIPAINFTSFSDLNDPLPSLVRNQTLRLGDSLKWIRAKHTVTWGGEIRRIQLNSESSPQPRGLFNFTGVMTSQLTATGQPVRATPLTEPYYELADFLLGLPYSTTVQYGPNIYLRSWDFIVYAQDDFRINKHFTLLLGARYEAATPPVDVYNRIANLDLNSTATQVAVVTPGAVGAFNGAYPRALIHGDYGNWAPRVGFAWVPQWIKPKTVVRGGYSIFYNEAIYNTLAQQYLEYEPPFATSENLITSAAQVLTLPSGFPATGTISNKGGVNPFYKDGYAQLWTLGTETSFAQNWILDLTYTGTKGTDLDLLRAPNRAPLGTSPLDTQVSFRIPYANSFYYDQSGANSIYNALQARIVHRFTKGFSLQGFYTFAKSLDNASTIGGSAPIVVQQDGNYAAERGLSSFDVRHQVRFFSVYELPFGEHHRRGNHGWTEHVLSNWRLQNIVTWQTGTPYTAYLGGTSSDNGTGASFSLRAEQVGNPNVGVCGNAPLVFFNTAAFTTPAPSAYGNERRGAIEGPCKFNWNASLAKSFRFGPQERHHLDIRWEVQNLSNTPSFSGLSTLLGSSSFGRVTSASIMRTMDVMMRYNF
ncbi:MAG: carboxypeptidase-like regulatory domain-containing protein [Candidatus Acidiferrales bacterium]